MEKSFLVVAAATVALLGAPVTQMSVAVGVEGRTNANVSMDARRNLVVMAWAATKDGATDIYAAVSRDGGQAFAAPVRVNDVQGSASVSGEQPPRVAIVEHDGPSWVDVMWTSKSSGGTRLMTSRSVDSGRSFARATVVPGSDAKGNRGWESMAATAPGQVFRIWLDHRELAEQAAAAPMNHSGQAHTGHGDADGVSRAQLSKLYFSGSADSAQGARAIAAGVCYCCKTALAVAPDGTIYAAWRHVYPGNVRDIAFTASRDGGRTFAAPVRVSNDDWVLDGCPENGPSLAVDAHGTVHVVWPTLVNGADGEPSLALFYATSNDGRTFTPRTRIPTEGTPRHPQIAIDAGGRVIVAWDEQLTASRRVVVDEALREGKDVRFRSRTIVDSGRNEYPGVAAVERGFVVAWTAASPAGSTIRVSRVTAGE